MIEHGVYRTLRVSNHNFLDSWINFLLAAITSHHSLGVLTPVYYLRVMQFGHLTQASLGSKAGICQNSNRLLSGVTTTEYVFLAFAASRSHPDSWLCAPLQFSCLGLHSTPWIIQGSLSISSQLIINPNSTCNRVSPLPCDTA